MITSRNTAETTRPWLASYPEGLEWDIQMQGCPLHAMLDETRRNYGNKPAMTFYGKQWTWEDIGRLSERLARGLQSIGYGKGSKIGLFLPNTPYYLIGYFAIARAGATIVNFNPLYAEREILHQIEDSNCDLMITLNLKAVYDKIAPMLDKTRLNQILVCPFEQVLPWPKAVAFSILKRGDIADVPHSDRHLWYTDVIDNTGRPDTPEIDPNEDLAVLQYTGGTTGLPKGAMLTHSNLTCNVEQCLHWFVEAKPGQEKMLGVIPFFHVFAMTAVMNLSVRAGFEIVALPKFELRDTLKLIHKHRPDYFPAVPAIYNAIINDKHKGKYDLTSLKACISGGAPLPVEVKKRFEAVTGCVVVEGYGLTETSPVACVNPLKGENKPGSIGLPLPATDIAILDKEDKQTPVEQGAPGELCISGPQVMKGYWQRDEETAEALRDGRMHTGDVAEMDADGYIYIVDRIKDMIITNGYNVYPRHVEEAIYLHPAVEECIVAGLPDDKRGERVKAWVKLHANARLEAERLKGFLEDKISPIEMPREIDIRYEPLPKTLIGKLSRKDIVEQELGNSDDT